MTFAEQLKSQLNIVEVIGQVVRLKRQGAGSRYVGLCPFHADKNPSFNVNSALQIYKCFACDAAGDVYKFVMEREGLTFPETLKTLAERYGIPMPERERADDPETRQRSALMEMHEIAATLFQDNLRGPGGAEARKYLESRGVSLDLMNEFRLGLAEASGHQLTRRLQKFGATLLDECGLAIKRQEGNEFFDRFRARLMFPIHDESGKVIAFGGRALRSNDEPKYLNSPETRIYKKSAVLYNLHRAKADARKHDRMVLVEGYMDVIGVYGAGIREVVASSGTSLSVDQVRSIKRQVSQRAGSGQIILNFDPDTAGARSTEKYIGAFLAEGLRVNVLEIPGGLDPDEYIQKNGAAAYQAQLEKTTSYFYWLADRAREKFDMHTAEGRTDAFRHLLPVIQQVHDKVERGMIAAELGEYLKVARDTVMTALRRNSGGEPSVRARNLLSAIPPNEKLLVGCLLAANDARIAITQHLRRVKIAHVLELGPIFEVMLALENDGAPFSLDAITSRLEPRMQKILAELSFSDFGMREEDAVPQALRCLEALEMKANDTACNDLRCRIRELEQAGNISEALMLLDQLNRMKRAS